MPDDAHPVDPAHGSPAPATVPPLRSTAPATASLPVTVVLHDGVAVVTLDSPRTRNALSRALVAALDDALTAAVVAGAGVVVLTHAAPVFCAGADLKERAAAGGGSSAAMAATFDRIAAMPMPVIAAITGPARAGGIGLMAACDLIVVDRAIDFALTEVRLGVTPAVISPIIFRRCDPAAMIEAYLTGAPFSAETALAMRLVTHLADGHDGVWETVTRLVNGILSAEPAAVAATKGLLWGLRDVPPDAVGSQMLTMSDRFFSSEPGREGMAAFAERRPPRWVPSDPWQLPAPR